MLVSFVPWLSMWTRVSYRGTDETHSVFAAPVTTGAVAAASLIDNIARCGVAGSETVYFQPSLQWCRKFSGKGKGPLEDPILWSAWSNVLYWMGGLKRISLANDKTLEKYGFGSYQRKFLPSL